MKEKSFPHILEEAFGIKVLGSMIKWGKGPGTVNGDVKVQSYR